jgi:hypothetical protein
MNAAEQDWEISGHKAEVERYMATKEHLEFKKSPVTFVQQYQSDIRNAEISDLTGPGVIFCTTYYSPSDVFDPNSSWASIELKKEEINRLVQNAPDELKSIFSESEDNDPFDSVSLEYNNVDIIRPW